MPELTIVAIVFDKETYKLRKNYFTGYGIDGSRSFKVSIDPNNCHHIVQGTLMLPHPCFYIDNVKVFMEFKSYFRNTYNIVIH